MSVASPLSPAYPFAPRRASSRCGAEVAVLGVAVLGIAVLLGSGCGRAKREDTEAKVKALVEKGAACFDEGRYDCAMESFAAAAKRKPKSAQAWNRFAVSARLRYYVTGEADFRDQELEALRRAAKLDTRSTDVQVNLGTVCWELGLREEAAVAYRAALGLAPDHPDALLMRARIQRSAEEPEEGARRPRP